VSVDVYVSAVSTADALIPSGIAIQEHGLLTRGMVPVRDHVAPALDQLCAGVALDGLDPDTSCFVGACGWTDGFGADQVTTTVDQYGWKWIDPEAFLFYSPHSVAAAVCVRRGLRGVACTLLGEEAHQQALALAAARCASGRGPALVISVHSAPTAEGLRVCCRGVLLSATGGLALLTSAADPYAFSDLSMATAVGLGCPEPADEQGGWR
jgi:hypothetical protein